MNRKIFNVALVVKDYDEAIEFYTHKLNFHLVEDSNLSEDKRWVIVAPGPESEARLLLAKAKNKEEESRIGNQTGGRVFLFLETDNFDRDYQHLVKHEVNIIRQPQTFDYGTVAVFSDLYGNLWDLIQHS